MAKHITQIFLIVFLLFGSLLTAQEDAPPVVKLRALYNNDIGFKTTIEQMFDNVQPLENGADNPWKNKNFEDLCVYLNEWFYFLPGLHDGLDRIIEFSYLYYKNPDGMKFILEEPGLSWTFQFIEERGKFMDSAESAKGIDAWYQDPSFSNKDFIVPDGGYTSFNQFFTRELKPGSRPVDNINDDSILVSPADGVVNIIANELELEMPIPTKAGMFLSLNKLLGHSELAAKFEGGTAMALFLMPTNYHHYHAPVSGTMVESKVNVGDRLFGMPDIPDMVNKGNPGYNKDYSVFQDFKHGYFIIETEEYGYVAMDPIGLQTVGSVVFEEKFLNVGPTNPVRVYKGDKLGHFAYGGSTVLMIFEKGRIAAVTVDQGQRIGKLQK